MTSQQAQSACPPRHEKEEGEEEEDKKKKKEEDEQEEEEGGGGGCGTIRDVPETEVLHESVTEDDSFEVLYGINDTPSWPLCVLLGFQHYLTAFGSTLTLPLLLAAPLCVTGDDVALSEIIGTIFFVSGIATLMQSTLGVRLPIIQGATFSFLAPTFSILSLPEWRCPARVSFNSSISNSTSNNSSSSDMGNISSSLMDNVTGPARSVVVEMLAIVENGTTSYAELGGEVHREVWHSRLREIQGAIMVASVVQVMLGFSGVFSIVLRYIGPLVIAPTVTLVGLALFDAAASKSASLWWIAIMTLVLIVLFSQCLHKVLIPLPKLTFTLRPLTCQLTCIQLPIFGLFPVLLAMISSWLVCLVLTVTGALTSDPDGWGYSARTDARAGALIDASWIRVPYPGQWGVPTVSVSGVLGMVAGVLASMIESVGDYYACARLSGAPSPPSHALNRGIGIEGIGCIIAGAFGSGNGTTSYSENVAAIGVTKVASRRVVQTAGVLLLLLGCLGKVGALFVTIPDPVVGGMFLGMFGMITAVGLSNVRYVDMRKPRNMCVLGLSLFVGLALPRWITAHPNVINTGVDALDQIIEVLLSTSMFVGGFIGFVLDNLLPGTDEERGITKWNEEPRRTAGREGEEGDTEHGRPTEDNVYSSRLLNACVDCLPLCGRLPFFPPVRKVRCPDVGLEKGAVGAGGKENLMEDSSPVSDVHVRNGRGKDRVAWDTHM